MPQGGAAALAATGGHSFWAKAACCSQTMTHR